MITVAIFNIIVVYFAYLARNERMEFWLKGSFILIFLFLALRYDYGNDYSGYLEGFLKMNRIDVIDYFDKDWHYEPGWILLCRLFKPFGFFALTAALALFNCFVYYYFIKKYVPSDYYWLAVFLYVFNPDFMLIHSSAMRQSIAISLFLFAIDYLYKKDVIRYCLCICLASLFHTSALILLPLFLLGLYNWKITKLTAIGIFSLFIFLFLFGKDFLPDMNRFIDTYFNKYEAYQEGTKISTGLGLILFSAIFALVLFYATSQSGESSLLFKIAGLSFFMIPAGLLIQMFARVGMYFQPATLAVYPIVLLNIKNPIFKDLSSALLVLVTLYFFYEFFHSDTYSVLFGTYSTIFSAPEVY